MTWDLIFILSERQRFWNLYFVGGKLIYPKNAGVGVVCIYLENEDVLLKKRRLPF